MSPALETARDQFGLQFYRLSVGVPVAGNLLAPDVRNGVHFPHALGPGRPPLQHHQVLGSPAAPVAHSQAALFPGQHVHHFQPGAGQPVGKAAAKVELVHPQKQVAAFHQDAVKFGYEAADRLRRHLLQLAAGLSPSPSLVSVAELVEHAAVLRIEERDRNCGCGQPGQEFQAIQLDAGVRAQPPGGLQRR